MKKLSSLLLAIAMLMSVSIPAFAITENTTEDGDSFNINNYTQYTIHLAEQNSNMRTATGNSIDRAIAYVESLELGNTGYSHIEEACLNELNGYKETDVVLENYTVLVPKTSATHYYGTYANSDFYYEYTSVADMRRDTYGTKKNTSNSSKWNSWILGTMDLAMCFAPSARWSVAYSLIRSITGVSSPSAVHYGSYNQYVEQFSSTKTRTIFKKRGNSFDDCYQDQTSSLRVNLYFCPVGTAFAYDYYKIGTVFSGTVKANTLTKNEILSQANAYSNHHSKITYSVSTKRVTENWY